MTWSSWSALLVAWFAALTLPGPDGFLILRFALRERRAAALAALGVMTGNLIWITVSVLGLTAILRSFPLVLPIMQVLGVVVLAFLGVQTIHGGIKQVRHGPQHQAVRIDRRPWLLGVVTNLANPKVLIFFTALLTQFLPPEADWALRASIVLVMTGTGLAWFLFLALASSLPAFRRWFARAAPWIDIVAGWVFLFVAGVILVEVTTLL